MSGECDLKVLLQSMTPELLPGVFVFCTLPEGQEIPPGLKPVSVFREREGTSILVPREEAERAQIPFQFAARQITLTVHSSLNAVGFMAAITTCLAQESISVNPVSAFYHDHLFVPEDRADDAMRLLRGLSKLEC
jgi:hypothetical protein